MSQPDMFIQQRQMLLKVNAMMLCDIVALYTHMLTSTDIEPELYAQFQKHVRLFHGCLSEVEKDIDKSYSTQLYTRNMPSVNILKPDTP